jgi:NTE family protein
MSGPTLTRKPKLALILSGGGARAAYQAGVARALAEHVPADQACPFPIICGTSAGAINAAALAAGACDMRQAAESLCAVWSRLTVGDIYQADAAHLTLAAWRMVRSLLPGSNKERRLALLDHAPLAALLSREIDFSRIAHSVAAGVLEALTITASSYQSGMSVSFCTGTTSLELWRRAQRMAIRADIEATHLLASSAIPFIFPPVEIGGEYFGDGAMRQMAPTAPALHLGADRILVVGAARTGTRTTPSLASGAPSLAQVGSHVLAGIFTDALGTDLEKVRLINVAVRQIPAEQLDRSPMPLRDVAMLVLTPSVPLETLAIDYVHRLPAALRMLLRRTGGTTAGGEGLLSYLLFDGQFCAALIDLGYRDARAKRAELETLLTAPQYCELPTSR